MEERKGPAGNPAGRAPRGFTVIRVEPWLEGPRTKVWTVPFDVEKSPTALGCWLIHAPWMHPLWSYHVASLVHLRDHDGVLPAKLQAMNSTHEFLVFALDPDHEPVELVATQFAYLRPASIAQQFARPNDAEALQVVERALGLVAAGRVSVDSDFRSVWWHLLTMGCGLVQQGAEG